MPSESSEDICKEFYANAFISEEGTRRQYISYVRGKEVKYDWETIQNLLKTAFHDPTTQRLCQYEQKKRAIERSMDQMEASQDVLECIALPGVVWEPTRQNRPRRIKLKDLKTLVKIWYHFVVSTIMPTTNHTEVGLHRAILLWAIVTGEKIDLPRILCDSIYDFAHDVSNKSSLGHSSLIQYLCQYAGVEIPPPEERTAGLLPEINVSWISKTLNIPLNEEVQEEGPSGHAQQQRRAPAGQTQTMDDRMTALETEMRSLRTEFRFMRQRDHYEYERQHAHQAYMSSQMAYLCIGREDGPPPFHPAPYDASEEDAYYAAQAGPSAEASDTPDFVRDAEDDEMAD